MGYPKSKYARKFHGIASNLYFRGIQAKLVLKETQKDKLWLYHNSISETKPHKSLALQKALMIITIQQIAKNKVDVKYYIYKNSNIFYLDNKEEDEVYKYQENKTLQNLTPNKPVNCDLFARPKNEKPTQNIFIYVQISGQWHNIPKVLQFSSISPRSWEIP